MKTAAWIGCFYVLLPLTLHGQEPPRYGGAWPAGLTVSRTGEFVHAGRTYHSSSSLSARWQAPEREIAYYVLVAVERRGEIHLEAPPDSIDLTIENLKAGTSYTIYLRACVDPECTEYIEADRPAAESTEEEYWRVQGSGSSFQTASSIVADGNVGSHAIRYGPWAGPELDGKIQLYYVAQRREDKGVKIGELEAPLADSIKAASSFRGVTGFGLKRVCQPVPAPAGGQPVPDPTCVGANSVAMGLNLFQAVPLPEHAGGNIRLYFEAQGSDGRTRILYLDSVDGYAGRDFHPGPQTECATLADYSPGGACEPTPALGVDIDGERGNPGIRHARQFKIGYPVLDSWVWDMSPGTYMWFTTEWPDGRCSQFPMNAAYALWDGERWRVDYREDGCPKMLEGAQAAYPVHMGGGRYKLYFNRRFTPQQTPGATTIRKPMQMVFADARHSGDPSRVEFEDWEPLSEAREVNYLWPDGGLLTESDESSLDDYAILAPTNDPKVLIMYTNMSWAGPGRVPFIGSAVLVNP